MKQELVLKEKLPEGWKWSTLGKECDLKIGGTPSRGNSEYFKGSNLWVSVSDLNGGIINDTREKITDDALDNSNVKLVKKGTPLICFKLSLGKKGIAGKDLYTNEAIAALEIKPESNLTNEFLFYYLDRINFFDYSNTAAKGNCLNKDILATVKILVPKKEDIKKIVSKLDAQMAQIEIMKKEAEKGLESASLIKAKIISALFNEESSKWKSKKIVDICELWRGSSPRPKGDPKYYGGKIPRLLIADITRDGKYVTPRLDSLTEEGAKLSRFMEKGTVIMAVSGSAGLPAILEVDACIHDGFVGFSKLNKDVLPEYLYELLKYQEEINNSKSSGAIWKNLTTDQIKDFDIPIPSIDEQENLIRFFNQIEEHTKIIITNHNNKLSAINQLPSSLLNEVFGKYEIPEVK